MTRVLQMTRRVTELVAVLLISACAPTSSGLAGPTSTASAQLASSPLTLLAACPDTRRPQSELDFAGFPPLVPDRALMLCLMAASTGGSAYDAGSTHQIRLTDGSEVRLYERRGPLPYKPTAVPATTGTRTVRGETWQSTTTGGSSILSATIQGTYVELSMSDAPNSMSELERVAASLVPVSTLPRPPARDLCAALQMSTQPTTVAAAFDSSATAIAKWEETPQQPGGPAVTSSDWRKAPASELVTLCYLDGDFGPPRTPPGPGATPPALPDWDRIVVLLGIDRRPIPRIYGWRTSIAIQDPGR